MNDNALDANSVIYQPALDEPCIFTGNHRRVSAYWLLWYIRRNPKTKLAEAVKRGEELTQRLLHEPRREMSLDAEPVKHIEVDYIVSVDHRLDEQFQVNSAKEKQVLRQEWIIWYSHAHGVGFGSAWHAGMHDWPNIQRNLKTIGTVPEE